MFVTIKAKFDKQAKKYSEVTINADNINYIGNGEIMMNKGLVYIDKESEANIINFIRTNYNNVDLVGTDDYTDEKETSSISQKIKNLLHNRSKN